MVHVDNAHSTSTKNKPSQLDFCLNVLMSLKHGNSLLLKQGIKNG